MSEHVIERRAYGPDSTAAEVAAIRGRLSVHAPGVILYREMPVQSAFHLGLFDERLGELVAELNGDFVLLVDLTEADAPSAETRAMLKALFAKHCRDKVCAVFTGRNFVLNVAARFVLGSILGAGDVRSFTIHKTLEEALRAVGR